MPHTSGPWVTNQSGLVTAGKNRLHIAQTATIGMGHAADANARLIAAAPDLLAALRDLEWACSGVEYMESEYSEQLAQARAALNKAIGE